MGAARRSGFDADWAMRDLRRPFSGVAITGWGPITPSQRWMAATKTAPGTVLTDMSGGAFWGMRQDAGRLITVTRRGSRGPHRMGDLIVSYSTTLDGNVVDVGGLRVTTPERTLIDLWGSRPPWERTKLLREALRRRITTPVKLLAALDAHRGHRGVALLRAELLGLMHLPFDRCNSDAEAFGLVILDEAGVQIPVVNEIVAGHEADFCWIEPKEIIEIDGPQWHRFKEFDARKTRDWARAGFLTQRISSTLLFAEPQSLLTLVPPSIRRP